MFPGILARRRSSEKEGGQENEEKESDAHVRIDASGQGFDPGGAGESQDGGRAREAGCAGRDDEGRVGLAMPLGKRGGIQTPHGNRPGGRRAPGLRGCSRGYANSPVLK